MPQKVSHIETFVNQKVSDRCLSFRSDFLETVDMKNRIKEFRRSMPGRMSQEKLGEKIGVTKATISKLEKGEQGLTQEYMEQIAKVLGRKPHELIMDDETKFQSLQPEQEKTLHSKSNTHDLIPLYGPQPVGEKNQIYLIGECVLGYEQTPPALQNVRDGKMILIVENGLDRRLFKGDKIWLHPYGVHQPDGLCVIEMRDHAAMICRYISETASHVKIYQNTPARETLVKKTAIRHIYKVVGIGLE